MNKKIVAIIIPLMMVLSGVVVAANTVADDSTSTSSDANNQSFIVGESFYLNVNEANYINYKYTAEWVIGSDVLAKSVNINNYTAVSVESVESNGVKYSIIPEKTLGNYKIKTEKVGETLGKTTIEWKITIVINSDSTNSKTIKVTKTLDPTPAEKLTFKWAKGDNHKDPAVNTVYDEAIVATLGTTDIISTYRDVSFYAIGLPEGLSMSSDGHINGIAKTTGNTTANIAVSYTDNNVKKIVTGTYEINVVAKGDIGFSMNIAEHGSSTRVTMTDGSFYIAVENTDPIVLTVTPTGDVWKANAHVKVVGSSGVVSDESKYGESFDIPVNGTGAYTVIVEYAGVTQSFTLYVLPSAELSADIIISGN